MRPHFHKVPVGIQRSFSIRHDEQAVFPAVWHFHPELELHYVIRGEGMRFIGDNISNFSGGEILLLGENLPHTWRCREEYYDPQNGLSVEAIVIHFLPDCLGKDFLKLPEAYMMLRLFEKAKKGLVVKGETAEALGALMKQALMAENLERIILLLRMLQLLCETSEYEMIASAHAFYKSNEVETQRLNKVCSYTLAHYKQPISLEEIAALSNLSVTSFCRYFKMMTRKTFYDFLIEIRISHACRCLVEDRFPTEMICFECGFRNVSNFYRHFKKVTGLTPYEYKKKYLNEYQSV